jgi:hypothetical protein
MEYMSSFLFHVGGTNNLHHREILMYIHLCFKETDISEL